MLGLWEEMFCHQLRVDGWSSVAVLETLFFQFLREVGERILLSVSSDHFCSVSIATSLEVIELIIIIS